MSQTLHSRTPAKARAESTAAPVRSPAEAAKPREGRVVLFATDSVRPAEASLRTAESLADRLRARLVLLSVVSARELRPSLIREPERESAIERFVEHARSATGYVRAVLRQRYAEERHTLKVGAFFEQTRLYAQELDALMIVLNDREHSGNRVTALARASGRPVLVARGSQAPLETIVAATALQHQGLPVLRRACELRASCGSDVVCVHHPSGARVSRVPGASRLRSSRARKRRAARRVLAQVCGSLGVEVVITPPSQDPAQATLQLASHVHADLIVVGTGVRSALVRALRRGVANRIVDASTCSVLVTPLT